MSKNFQKVFNYYKQGYWNKKMVYNAVGKWITKEEYEQITEEVYK